jgi:hypothetical protein
MSSNWTVDPNYYNFIRWEDGSTEPTRTIFVTEDTTITATYLQPTPAEFTFTDLIISTEEVTVGEDYNVSATATNVGDLEGSCDVSLTVNGVLDDVKTISLAGGESTTIVFTLTATTAGKPITMMFIVAIDGLEGTVIINPTPDSNILYVALTALIASAVAIVVIIRHLNRRRPTGLRRWKEQA